MNHESLRSLHLMTKSSLKRYRRLARLLESNSSFTIKKSYNSRVPHIHQSDYCWIVEGDRSGFIAFPLGPRHDTILTRLSKLNSREKRAHHSCQVLVKRYIEVLEFIISQQKQDVRAEYSERVAFFNKLRSLCEENLERLETDQGRRLASSVKSALSACDETRYLRKPDIVRILEVVGVLPSEADLVTSSIDIVNGGIPSSNSVSAWLLCLMRSILASPEMTSSEKRKAFERDFRSVRSWIESLHRMHVTVIQSGSDTTVNLRNRTISQRMLAAFDSLIQHPAESDAKSNECVTEYSMNA